MLFAAKSTLLQKSHIHSLWLQGKPYQSGPKKKPQRNQTHTETAWDVWMCLIRDSERVHSLLWKKERSGSQNAPSWSKRGCAAPEVLLMVSTGSWGFFYHLLKPWHRQKFWCLSETCSVTTQERRQRGTSLAIAEQETSSKEQMLSLRDLTTAPLFKWQTLNHFSPSLQFIGKPKGESNCFPINPSRGDPFVAWLQHRKELWI